MSVSKKIGLLIIGIIALTGAGMLSSPTFAELLLNTFQGGKVTSNLVAQWSFDGRFLDTSSSTSEVKDGTGTHNGNWLNHSTTTDIGKLGQALYFDGLDDKVSVADDNALDFTGTDDFSISLWFNSTASTTYASGYSGTSTYYFNSYDIGGEEWGTTPANMVDGSTATYATDNTDNLVQALKSSEAVATTSGAVPDKVEYRAFGYQDTGDNGDLDMWPVFDGTTDGPITIWAIPVTTGAWSPYYDITSTTSAPSPWTWTDLVNLDMDIRVNKNGGPDVMNVARVETRVEWSVPGQPVQTTATTTLISKADATSGGYKIYLQGDGDLCFAIDDDGTWGPEDEVCTSGTDYSDTSDWHHVIATKDGTSGIYLYVDDPNTPKASDTSLTATGDLSNGSPFYLGDDGEGSYDEYVGLLDEVALYSSVLTQQERERLYRLGQTMLLNAPQTDKVTDGLVAHWPLDGGTVGGGYSFTNVVSTTTTLEKFFTSSAPDVLATADQTITGEAVTNGFSIAAKSGDLNGDGFDDVAVTAWTYNSNQGRVYVFYGNAQGLFPASAADADVIITGEATGDVLGNPGLLVADVNADGVDDLVIAGYGYNNGQGRVYINYGGSLSTGAANTVADVILTGESQLDRFGWGLTSGDFNDDGDLDFATGAFGYNNNGLTGRAYVFHGPTFSTGSAATADVILTGETTTDEFGSSVLAGDWDYDGKDDLAVGASGYNSEQGRVYVFYNASIVTGNATTADITLTGDPAATADFGNSMYNGDVNDDDVDDLIVSGWKYNSNQGRTYIFYGGSLVTENATSADVILTGDGANNYFGRPALVYDFDRDGNNDLLLGAEGYNASQGRGYIFNSSVLSGSIGTSSAEVVLTGEATGNFYSLMFNLDGDFNGDGVADLLIGSDGTSSDRGRLYMYYSDVVGTAYATGTTLAVGRIGQAASFDGVNDEAQVGTSSESLKSVSFWMKADDTTSRGVIDLNGTARVELDASSQLTGAGWSSPTYYVDRVAGNRTITTDWHHVVITSATGINATNTVLGLTGGSYFDGILDEVRFYDKVLTQDEINKLYAQGGTFVLNAPQKEKQTTGLIGHWTFDGKDIDGVTGVVKNVASTSVTETGRFGASTITADTAEVIYSGEQDNGYFGFAVTSVGDMNADGYDDIFMGADSATDAGTQRGIGYLVFGPQMKHLDAENADVLIFGQTDGDWFANAVSAAGDINNDGYDDLLVGAGSAEDTGTQRGEVYIFYGPMTGTTSVNAENADVIVYGTTDNDYFGNAVSNAGDVDGDGYDDILVGAWYAEDAGDQRGAAYIFLGSTLIATTSMNAENADVIMYGEVDLDDFGVAVSGAGDVNGDGYSDVIVGAWNAEDGGACTAECGLAYLFYGSSTMSATINAESADVIFNGETNTDSFGRAVAGVGDIDGDGYDDLLVGAYQAEDGGTCTAECGLAYLFYGSSSLASSINAENADVIFNGEVNTDYFGRAVSRAGDVNGDGNPDLLIGAYYAQGGGTDRGSAYLFYGPFTGTTSVDAQNADVIFSGKVDSDLFGVAVSASGDINGDGFNEVLVGAYQAEDTGTNRGQAFVFSPYGEFSGPLGGATQDIGRIGQGLSITSDFFGVQLNDISSIGQLKSVSFWMKPADLTSTRAIKLNATASISIGSASELVAANITNPTYYKNGIPGTTTVDSEWQHVVITTDTAVPLTDVEFARSQVVGGNYTGILDEIRFYDHVLSQEEVTKLYLQGK